MAQRNIAFDPYRTALVTQGYRLPSSIVPHTLAPTAQRGGLSSFGQIDLGGVMEDILDGAQDQIEGSIQQLFDGIGGGKEEANYITPVQNLLMFRLGNITQQILTGLNPSVDTLQTLYSEVARLAQNFVTFVLNSRFTDRRASGQALNTVMPYINGSCGYAVPLGATAEPTLFNCLSWGDGTIGGVGTNGMLGAISRAIQAAGGSTPGTGGGVPGGGGITPGTETGGVSWGLIAGIALMVYNYSKGNG